VNIFFSIGENLLTKNVIDFGEKAFNFELI
jgi:hypothetical protein